MNPLHFRNIPHDHGLLRSHNKTPLVRAPSVCLFRRIGRTIAFNVYAVAVIYLRFAVLTLAIYLVAHWYFAEFEMVQRDQEAGAASLTQPSSAPLTTTPTPALHGGELWSDIEFIYY